MTDTKKHIKFKNPVKPGDVFETKCEITKVREPFYFAKGSGYVNGKLCVSAEFSFAVTNKNWKGGFYVTYWQS